jgi:structure-specific recognition protein 1
MGLDPRLESGEASRDPGEALVAMMEMASGVAKATRPKTSGSKGFAGVGGRGCVKANVKFNQGFLFCLPDGFAFVDRPALYLPFDDLADLQLARAEGVGSSFDLIVSRVEPTSGRGAAESRSQGDAFEFANISREELDGVRRYLAKNCSEKGEGEAGGKNAEGDDDDAFDARSDDDDDDDSDDEDFGVAQDLDEEESDDDDDSESGDDDDEEEEEASDSEEDSADGAGRKRARDDIPAATEPAAGEDPESASEEEEDDSDEDGAFEVVPVAKTARR